MPIEVKNFSDGAGEAKDMPNARTEAVNAVSYTHLTLPTIVEV